MSRSCPCCAVPLSPQALHGQQVDRCDACGGLYFDAGELESVVELVGWYSAVRLDEADIDSAWDREPARALACPVHGVAMHKHDLAGLVLDQCPRCQGIWLDDGEVAALMIAQDHVRANVGLYLRLGN